MEIVYEPIFACDLLDKWGCSEGFLNNVCADGELTAYICKDIRVDPKSHKKVALCEKTSECLFYFDVANNPKEVIFPGKEVAKYESCHEEILWKKIDTKHVVDPIGDWIDEVTSLENVLGVIKRGTNKDLSDKVSSSNSKTIEEELAIAHEKIKLLEQQIEHLKIVAQKKPIKTASACEAAQASRVEEWKRYAVVMAKIAYDCGLEDRKQVTRSEYMTLAKRYGELSKQALELLRNALPEGVTNTTGGASKQG